MDEEDHMGVRQTERLPVLSVAIPTYNRAETLRRQLGSLLGQIVGCQEDVEVVVSDNASSDGTASVVAEMREHSPGIRYVRNEANLGANRNIDAAVRACRHASGLQSQHRDSPASARRSTSLLAGVRRRSASGIGRASLPARGLPSDRGRCLVVSRPGRTL